MVYLEPLENIKLESFNIRHFEMWRQFMNSKSISTRYKNGVYKYLKALMNFGTKWYDINFVKEGETDIVFTALDGGGATFDLSVEVRPKPEAPEEVTVDSKNNSATIKVN